MFTAFYFLVLHIPYQEKKVLVQVALCLLAGLESCLVLPLVFTPL